MKQLKTFAIALAVMVGGSTFANSKPVKKNSENNSAEISLLLKDKFLTLEKDLFTKVVFTVDAEKNIVVNSVLTKEEFVREYILRKMEDKHLTGKNWEVGKTYIVPVRMKAI